MKLTITIDDAAGEVLNRYAISKKITKSTAAARLLEQALDFDLSNRLTALDVRTEHVLKITKLIYNEIRK